MCTVEGLKIVRQICLPSELNNKFEDNVDDLVVVVSGPSSTVGTQPVNILHTSHMHTCKAECRGSLAHLWGGRK